LSCSSGTAVGRRSGKGSSLIPCASCGAISNLVGGASGELVGSGPRTTIPIGNVVPASASEQRHCSPNGIENSTGSSGTPNTSVPQPMTSIKPPSGSVSALAREQRRGDPHQQLPAAGQELDSGVALLFASDLQRVAQLSLAGQFAGVAVAATQVDGDDLVITAGAGALLGMTVFCEQAGSLRLWPCSASLCATSSRPEDQSGPECDAATRKRATTSAPTRGAVYEPAQPQARQRRERKSRPEDRGRAGSSESIARHTRCSRVRER
jgi:hypothetical protein